MKKREDRHSKFGDVFPISRGFWRVSRGFWRESRSGNARPPPRLVALPFKLSPGFNSSSSYILLLSKGGEDAKILDNS